MAESSAATRRYGCPACGGGLQYDIDSGKMKCDRCDTLTSLAELPREEPGDMLEVNEFHCPQCGAAVYSTDTEVTSFCSFCGSDVVLTGKLGQTRRPAYIVPFQVTREKCEQAYRDHLKGYLLAPSALKKAETVSHFRPVYIPFWSYRVEAQGVARLEGKKSYTRGDYRYDETYDLTMDAVISQKGILYDASTAFEDETAALLQHTMQQAEPFHPAYLSGFYAQGADVPGETYHQEAAASAVRLFMDQVKEETGMDSVEMKGNIEENFGLPDARYQEQLVMMPVWLLAHRQGDRVVYTAINGRSGEVVCDVPVSNGKVAGVTLALAAGLFFLLHQFVTLKPELLMALCAVVSLIIQYQFSGAQKLLFNRRTRAYEPDFALGQRAFVGPAQALLRKGKEGISTRGTGESALEKLKGLGLILLAVLGYAGIQALSILGSAFGTAGGRRMIVLLALLGVLVTMGVHLARRAGKESRGPLWPRALSLLACLAGLVSVLSGQAEDLIYYGCAAAMLISAGIELVMINRAHNEYASRPTPFFGEKEAAA
ncbi:MAG: hypothetical protein IJ153_08760 [Clostridia bacterium]|nr:hypothetical protein [Clostridia bacterium]